MSDSLPKRHLRFHFSGNWKETGTIPNKLRCYSGGSKVESRQWKGDEVCLLDLAKEVYKLIAVPEGKSIAFSWFRMVRDKDYVNQRLPILDDNDVLFFWKNSKQDRQNFIQLYVEFVNPNYVGSINRSFLPCLQPCLQPTPPSSCQPKSVPLSQCSQQFDVSEIPPSSDNPIRNEELSPSSEDPFMNEELPPPSLREKLPVRRKGKSPVKPKPRTPVKTITKNLVKPKSPKHVKPKSPKPVKPKSPARPTRWSTRLKTIHCDDQDGGGDDFVEIGTQVEHVVEIGTQVEHEVEELDHDFLAEVDSTIASLLDSGNVHETVKDYHVVGSSRGLNDDGNGFINLDDDDDDDDSLDEDYVLSDNEKMCEHVEHEVHEERRPRTRSKGPPQYNIDRIDAEEHYESPYSYSDGSESEDDSPLTAEEIERAKKQIAEEDEIEIEDGCIESEGDQTGSGIGNEIEVEDVDRDWIRKTSRIDDLEYANEHYNKKKLKLGQRWNDIFKCGHALRSYAVRKKFVMKLEKNDSNRIVGVCKGTSLEGKPCEWKVSIGRMNDGHTMKVGVLYKVHCCVRNEIKTNPNANAGWIAKKIEKAMRVHHRSFTPRDIIGRIWAKHTVDIKYWQAWHALTMALALLHGNYEESYNKIPELCRQILHSNPGSIACCARNDQFNTFDYCCVAFKASLDGFVRGCRPIIGLDGCFLKGKYGGVCLSVVALDGNNGMFPLGVFVCVRENLNNWQRFLEVMEPHLSRHPQTLVIMSDRQKGLNIAVSDIFPNAHQRFCFRHITANMKRYFSGVDDFAWAASKAYSTTYWEKDMAEMHKLDPGATQYLMDENPCRWARSHFDREAKSEHTTNNWSEAFNARILEARDKPIAKLVTIVCAWLMKIQYERRMMARTWNQFGLVPRVLEIIELKKKKVKDYECFGSDDNLYQVNDHFDKHWTVDLDAQACTCGEWQLTGIPCVHGVRVLNFMRVDWKRYCSPFFTVEAYSKVYEGSIMPLLHEDEWPKITDKINPPIKTRGKGRPPIQRKRGIDEGPIRYGGKKQHRCSGCKEFGHNKRSCPGFDVDHANFVSASQGPAKKAPGRPRTRPRKIDYGVPTENLAEDPAYSELIAQFEPVVAMRGKGKKTYKGKGKKRTNAAQTSDASQPFDPSLYGYGTTSTHKNFQVRNQTPMHNTYENDHAFYGYVPTQTPAFQQYQPQYFGQFSSPYTSTMPQAPSVRPQAPPVRPQAPPVTFPQQQTPWKPPLVRDPYMRPPPPNRNVFRPQSVFPLHGTNRQRVAALLGIDEASLSQNQTGSSQTYQTGSSQASTSNTVQPRWRL